jgi:RNA polymerase sigma-70 factor (ECF subfamily)
VEVVIVASALAIPRQLTRSWSAQAASVDDEKTLVRRGQAGDNDAFARLVERNQTGVYNLALRMTRDPEEAVDLTQETFLRAWRSLSGFRAEAKFSTWLYRIAYNVCLSRRIVHRGTLADPGAAELVPMPDGEEPPAVILRQERRERVVAAMHKLAPAYRLVLDLYYWRDCTYEEIASILELPMGTVKTHLYRAKAALRTELVIEG